MHARMHACVQRRSVTRYALLRRCTRTERVVLRRWRRAALALAFLGAAQPPPQPVLFDL